MITDDLPKVHLKLTIAPTFTGGGPRRTPTLTGALIIPPPSALLWLNFFFFFLLLLRFFALLLFFTGFCILGLLCISKNEYTCTSTFILDISVALECKEPTCTCTCIAYLYTNFVKLKVIVLKMHIKLIYLLLNNKMQHTQGNRHVKWNILLYFNDFKKKINAHLENILYS